MYTSLYRKLQNIIYFFFDMKLVLMVFFLIRIAQVDKSQPARQPPRFLSEAIPNPDLAFLHQRIRPGIWSCPKNSLHTVHDTCNATSIAKTLYYIYTHTSTARLSLLEERKTARVPSRSFGNKDVVSCCV